MNFVFISPNFPTDFYQFCVALNDNGVTVLGVGDCPYDNLDFRLKASLKEYYYVESLENYDKVAEAVAYFENKYGHIDWLESNNEYWLSQDAKLRTQFQIDTGIKEDEIDYIKSKSHMKELYEKAGVKVARYILVSDLENAKDFAKEVGYPLVVKPDVGVGASNTFKINDSQELKAFFDQPISEPMIMEEYINGDLISYDGIANSQKEVIFETSHVFPRQVMNVVNGNMDFFYWSIRDIPDVLREAGKSVVKAFPTASRCFHLEFFALKEDKDGLGQKGDIIGLEVNMRTPGGLTPDMMNYASDINMFQIYADMVCYDKPQMPINGKKYYCVYAARRNEHNYLIPLEDIKTLFKWSIVESGRNDAAIAPAMGDQYVIARFKDPQDIWPFINAVVEDNK